MIQRLCFNMARNSINYRHVARILIEEHLKGVYLFGRTLEYVVKFWNGFDKFWKQTATFARSLLGRHVRNFWTNLFEREFLDGIDVDRVDFGITPALLHVRGRNFGT
jgi:hypothetical protein